MFDDHKYSLNRIVAYAHRDPEQSGEVYGPGGPERTYGVVIEVHRVRGEQQRWEYSVANSFTGEERRLNIPTTRAGILRLVENAVTEAGQAGGKVIWIMESTTGWARVKELIGSRVQFVMANVLWFLRHGADIARRASTDHLRR
jgi:hypothetical protein